MLRNFEQNRGVCPLPSVLQRVGAAVRACSLNLEMDAGSAGSRCALILLPWRPINTRTTLASLLIRAYFLNMPARAPENRSASGFPEFCPLPRPYYAIQWKRPLFACCVRTLIRNGNGIN